ncbi:hypothetical protein BDZ45DRAFT_807098 [Acephala macrosclerotiorum]|nr:hypothetical protein BDZ45DRAFT_807098 [Acephala macrosclerotiorum]
MTTLEDKAAFALARHKKESQNERITFCGPQTFVTITAGSGQDKHTFTVQKSLICHYSAFFDAAFNGGFLEGKSQAMDMEDVEGEIMGLLVDWLYLQRIQSAHGSGANVTMLDLAKLWTLADRCTIPDLQAAAMKDMQSWDRYCEVLNPTLSNTKNLAAFTDHVYGNNMHNGPLSKLYIDIVLGVCDQIEKRGRADWKDKFLGVLEAAMGPSAAFELLSVMIAGTTGFGKLRMGQMLRGGLDLLPEPAPCKMRIEAAKSLREFLNE